MTYYRKMICSSYFNNSTHDFRLIYDASTDTIFVDISHRPYHDRKYLSLIKFLHAKLGNAAKPHISIPLFNADLERKETTRTHSRTGATLMRCNFICPF